LFSFLDVSNGELDAGDLPVETFLFPREPVEVCRERLGAVALAVEHLEDRGNAEPQFAKQQDPL
jgi:hypothetical protein